MGSRAADQNPDFDAFALDDLINVPRRTAARAIGIPEDRLREWETRGLLRPRVLTENGTRRITSYSLDDLVQGRVIRILEDRHKIHIRQITRIVEEYRAYSEKPLSQLVWGVSENHIYLQFPDGGWVDGHEPGQGVMVEVIDLDEIRADSRRAIQRPEADRGKIEKRRGVQHSVPVFVGTRTPLEAVHSFLKRGATTEEILEAYPHLTAEDIDLARDLLTTAS